MAGASFGGADEIKEGVLFAVHADFDEVEGIAGGGAFDPEFVSGGAPEGGDFGFDGVLEGGLICVSEDEDFLGIGVLDDNGKEVLAGGADLSELSEVEIEVGAFFEVFHGGRRGAPSYLLLVICCWESRSGADGKGESCLG